MRRSRTWWWGEGCRELQEVMGSRASWRELCKAEAEGKEDLVVGRGVQGTAEGEGEVG